MERNNKRVLVVDDNRDLLYLLSVRLVSAGYMVYGAANGLEALEQMEKHSVDVVLTDYRMPKMDGFEFLSVCRVKWPGIPVVVFSGEQDDMAHEAVERGAFAWVRKGSDFTVTLGTPCLCDSTISPCVSENACRNLASRGSSETHPQGFRTIHRARREAALSRTRTAQ